ncbi:MAG: ribonuclease PH, partial [Isosphaeraceae bacterium]
MTMTRSDKRSSDQLRPVTIERGFIRNSAGSVLYRAGGTVVLVTASLSESVPPFLEGKSLGWLTAEYAMIPGSTPTRVRRGPDGRATEIQRLIGRSLRAIVDRQALGACTIHVDAEVLNADGGTRTAAITAAFVAVADAVSARFGSQAGAILRDSVAAVSAG